jgi:hypothetical protein
MKKNKRQTKNQNETPNDTTNNDVRPEDVIAGAPDADPVSQAYARTGRADTSGINGIPASDEDAGEERRKLYEKGATLVSRID